MHSSAALERLYTRLFAQLQQQQQQQNMFAGRGRRLANCQALLEMQCTLQSSIVSSKATDHLRMKASASGRVQSTHLGVLLLGQVAFQALLRRKRRINCELSFPLDTQRDILHILHRGSTSAASIKMQKNAPRERSRTRHELGGAVLLVHIEQAMRFKQYRSTSARCSDSITEECIQAHAVMVISTARWNSAAMIAAEQSSPLDCTRCAGTAATACTTTVCCSSPLCTLQPSLC
jgi:hypothetical protein